MITFAPFTVTVPDPIVLEKHVDEALRTVRRSNSTLSPVDRPAHTGDLLFIDLATKHDGKVLEQLTTSRFAYPLGEGLITPAIDSAIDGMAPGTTAVLAPVINGIPLEMEISVSEVCERVAPPNEALAELLLPAEAEERTFEAAIDHLEHALGVSRRGDALMVRKRGIEDHLAEMAGGVSPTVKQARSLSAELLEDAMPSEAALSEEEVEAEVLRRFRYSVALIHLSQRPEIDLLVPEAKVDEEFHAMRAAFSKPTKRRGHRRGKGRRPPTRAQLRSQLRNEATVQLIEAAAVLVTEEGRTVDRAELVEGGDWS